MGRGRTEASLTPAHTMPKVAAMNALTPKIPSKISRDELATLAVLEERILWLASWTIHNANHLRENRDGIKVGGHQASCASMTSLMTALYFKALRPQDRVAVKPHASPVFHAVQHLYGRQTIDQLQRFRGLGGAQSYPSRTKDIDDVDFSTGSVGLGVAVTAFASLVQDYLAARGRVAPDKMGRMISLLGDAELDEGNIYEALIEAYKHDLRNIWWIVDYNRQSLDATTTERMWDRFDDIFETVGWDVLTLKYGKRQLEAFAKPGGKELQAWIETCPNDLYAALSYQGGAAWRERLAADLKSKASHALISSYDDAALSNLMTQLGGHCLETLLEAFETAALDDKPKLFIAYTVKGWRLPFQGHKDNHSGLMTPTQIDALRETLGVPVGKEWEILAGLDDAAGAKVEALVASAPFADTAPRRFNPAPIAMPDMFDVPTGAKQATQATFGKIMADIAKTDSDFAGRIVTTSPDVTVSTNLGGFVNRRGLFSRKAMADVFKDRKIASPQTWTGSDAGQHIELGIAENNLFLNLAAFGLAGDLFGERLFPVGTLYDPFIARGLDALNYALYQNAKFILVSTPSGVTLGPEGGAHQSINTPLIGLGQPGLTHWEPAFADELTLLLHHAFGELQNHDGDCAYFRLSTRLLDQPVRTDTSWQEGALQGAYWLEAPAEGAELAIAYSGTLAPEARAGFEALREEYPGLGLLAITSPDLLHRGWTAAGRARWTNGPRIKSHIEALLAPLAPGAGLITMLDGSPSALSWLGSVCGNRVRALGVERFGQTGDLIDLYRTYRLDLDAILDAAADLSL
jgi:pyruvate dehydrogenase E1 component